MFFGLQQTEQTQDERSRSGSVAANDTGELSHKELKFLFDFNDKNKKGALTKSEFRAVIERLRKRERVLRPIDENVVSAAFQLLATGKEEPLIQWKDFEEKFNDVFARHRKSFFTKNEDPRAPGGAFVSEAARRASYLSQQRSIGGQLMGKSAAGSFEILPSPKVAVDEVSPVFVSASSDVSADTARGLAQTPAPPSPALASAADAAINIPIPSVNVTQREHSAPSASSLSKTDIRERAPRIQVPLTRLESTTGEGNSKGNKAAPAAASTGKAPVLCPHCGRGLPTAVPEEKKSKWIRKAATPQDFVPLYGPHFYSGMWEIGRVAGAIPPSFFASPYNLHTWCFLDDGD